MNVLVLLISTVGLTLRCNFNRADTNTFCQAGDIFDTYHRRRLTGYYSLPHTLIASLMMYEIVVKAYFVIIYFIFFVIPIMKDFK